jgi:hypothetical protein
VEPKYEKKLETLDDLLHSDIVYGYHPFVNYMKDTLTFPEFVSFLNDKELQEDCSDIRKCVERMITKKDIATVAAPSFATFVAIEMGTVDVDKVICFLDENAISSSLTVLFKKGNPLLDGFNILIRRYLEAGLLERLWSELQHRASLKGGGRYIDAAGYTFFAFSVSHLKPAFVVLLVGTVFSSVVFIGEIAVNCLCERRGRKKRRVRRVRVLYRVRHNRHPHFLRPLVREWLG